MIYMFDNIYFFLLVAGYLNSTCTVKGAQHRIPGKPLTVQVEFKK